MNSAASVTAWKQLVEPPSSWWSVSHPPGMSSSCRHTPELSSHSHRWPTALIGGTSVSVVLTERSLDDGCHLWHRPTTAAWTQPCCQKEREVFAVRPPCYQQPPTDQAGWMLANGSVQVMEMQLHAAADPHRSSNDCCEAPVAVNKHKPV